MKRVTYRLLGDAYIHGFMDGEAIEARDQGYFKERLFVLE
jgi:hypothetical protein